MIKWIERRSRREFLLLFALLCCIGGAAYAAEPIPASPLPEWFWPSVVSGLIQAAAVYGGLKVKLDWIFDRIKTNELAIAAVHGRMDRALEREHTGRSTD